MGICQTDLGPNLEYLRPHTRYVHILNLSFLSSKNGVTIFFLRDVMN